MANETVLKLAPAEPDAVDVDAGVSLPSPAPILVSKVELPAATILAVEPMPLTVTLLSVFLAPAGMVSVAAGFVNSAVVKAPLMVPSEVEVDSVPEIFEYAFW